MEKNLHALTSLIMVYVSAVIPILSGLGSIFGSIFSYRSSVTLSAVLPSLLVRSLDLSSVYPALDKGLDCPDYTMFYNQCPRLILYTILSNARSNRV